LSSSRSKAKTLDNLEVVEIAVVFMLMVLGSHNATRDEESSFTESSTLRVDFFSSRRR
jgi:hypothetical protein